MKRTHLATEIIVFDQREELPADDQALMRLAEEATQKAYAPYSNYRVGCAVLLANGEIVTGSNQENAAYPSGMCAERVAVYYAGAQYPGVAIVKIAITASSSDFMIHQPIAPCGACRQALLEYELKSDQSMVLFMSGQKGPVYRIDGLRQLLPLYFGQQALNGQSQ